MKRFFEAAILTTALTGVARGQADGTTAVYELTFAATWSAATHPTDFPSNPHFSGLVGGTHNGSARFWELGGIASLGIERMAERGNRDVLVSEVNVAIAEGSASAAISELGVSPSPGSRTIQFPVRSTYPLATVTTMIAPSPDWFVGVDSLPLYASGHWEEEVVIDLVPYDAGTDSGVTFTSADVETQPREPISQIVGFPFENSPPLGTFTFRLLSVTPPLLGDMDGDGDLDFDDVTGLVLGLNNSVAYESEYGLAAVIHGDLDQDGDLDFDDLDDFTALLTGTGSVEFQAVPEPASLSLALTLLIGAAVKGLRVASACGRASVGGLAARVAPRTGLRKTLQPRFRLNTP
jgi:hypothetical protein